MKAQIFRGLVRTLTALALCLPAVACSESEPEPPTFDEFCDGSKELKLVRSLTAVNTGLGQDVLWEVGPRLLLLTGECTYWVRWHVFQETRTGQLDKAAFDELMRDMHVAEWPALSMNGRDGTGDYCIPVFDAGTTHYWLEGQLTRVTTCWPATPMAVDLEAPTLAAIGDLYERTEDAVQGDVRYTVVESGTRSNRWQNAGPWPLGDIGDVAVHYSTEEAVPIFVARGEDADILRALRAQVLSGEVGDHFERGSDVPRNNYVPILEPDGTRYELYMREVTPYEKDGVLQIPD